MSLPIRIDFKISHKLCYNTAMNHEGEMRLGISQGMIDEAQARVAPFIDDTNLLEAVVKGRIAVISQQQPAYVDFVTNTGFEVANGINPLTFTGAIMLAYEMVPEAARNERFNSDEVSAMRASFHEYITRVVSEDSVSITIDCATLMGKLEEDSPDFIIWLNKLIDDLDGEEKKADTMFGFLLGVAPFYFRAETRKLSHEVAHFGE